MNGIPQILAVIAGFATAAVLTGMLIPRLKERQFKQFVREEGPKSHLSKTGTPSMGGLAIIAGTIISAAAAGLICGRLSTGLAAACIMMLAFGLIGFIDDYEKAIKKNNKGISPKQKIILQFVFSLGFAVFCYYFSGDYMVKYMETTSPYSSAVWIPIWNRYIELGIFYIPWVMFVMIAFSNSVNLTDGLDGLASSVTAIVAFAMAVAGGYAGYSDYPVFYAGIVGGCIGFLVYNRHPAKIFMGDTGSMALGGGLAAAAILMKMEVILAIAGLIYVLEAVSVILQVGYFKATNGKRIFRMAPLHHHFELGGRHETKVVRMFTSLTLVFCILAMLITVFS